MFLIQEARKKDQDEEFEKNVLHAICCEITTLLYLHDKGIGQALRNLPEGKPLFGFLHISQNFFTVFESNASHIGKIAPALSKDMVELYLVMKAMIEDLAVNKSFYERLKELNNDRKHLAPSDPDFEIVQASINFYQDAMVKQADRLRLTDARIHALADGLKQKYDSLPLKKAISVRIIRILVRAARGL